MKKLLFLLCVIAPLMMSAQLNYDKWETVETKDEFGDLTGDSVKRIFGTGKFSNSATSNSELTVKFVDYSDGAILELYGYGRAPGENFGGNFGSLKVKRSDGTIEEYKTYAPDSGGLFFDEGNEFLTLIRNGNNEELKISVSESDFSKYGRATYSFTLRTQ